MLDLVGDTVRDGRERGFVLCYDEKVDDAPYLSGKPCRGNECSVVHQTCQWPNEFLSFHTHPYAESMPLVPSNRDVQKSLAESDEAFCIGTKVGKKRTVRCWRPTTHNPTIRKFIDAWFTDGERLNTVASDMKFEAIFAKHKKPELSAVPLFEHLWDWK